MAQQRAPTLLLTREDPVDTSSFEVAILWPHPNGPRTHDTDGELYVATKYKNVKEIPSSLANCAKCHDKTTSDIFGRSGPRKAYLQADQARADATVTAEKEAAKGLKTYLQMREASGK